jgi:hypothetical protein
MTAVVPTKTGEEETHTPQRTPEKRSVFGITEAQKQALMDNLQLEGKTMHGDRGEMSSNTTDINIQ